MVILGILVVVAAPSYFSMRDRATVAMAKANIRALAIAAEIYAAENVGNKTDADGKKNTTGYKGMTLARLRAKYDASLALHLSFKGAPTQGSYCAVFSSGAVKWSAQGPGINADSYVNNAKCK